MDEKNGDRCRLCCLPSEEIIKIFGSEGVQLNIARTIAIHLRLQVNESDESSNMICIECWHKIQSFHTFYCLVELAQREFYQNLSFVDVEKKLQNESEDERSDRSYTPFIESIGSPIKSEEESSSLFDGDSGVGSKATNKSSHGKEIMCNVASNRKSSSSKRKKQDENLSLKATEEDLYIAQYFDMLCDLCTHGFRSLVEARLHYREKHNIVEGYLKCCNKKFKRRGYIMEHINWHLNPKLFMCGLCEKNLSSKRQLASHMWNHAPEHSKKYECDICKKRFSKKHILDLHIRGVHPVEGEGAICEFCNKSFKLKSTMKLHVLKVHQRIHEQICDVCARVFYTKEGFQHHLLSHQQIEETKVQCSYCGEWLKNRGSLSKHVKRHTDTPQKCKFCDKVKPNRSALTHHVRLVHRKAAYPCTLCDKTFKRPLALTEHMASHTGENLYTCSYCPKMFKSNSNMYKHKKQVHSDQWNLDRAKRYESTK